VGEITPPPGAGFGYKTFQLDYDGGNQVIVTSSGVTSVTRNGPGGYTVDVTAAGLPGNPLFIGGLVFDPSVGGPWISIGNNGASNPFNVLVWEMQAGVPTLVDKEFMIWGFG
jgi:hypothetical protein